MTALEAGAKDAVPPELLRIQIEASDPAASAFVSANAGSGKTYVLAQRVIRLLLQGVDPAKILCLTFTKAAAANMANRVFGQLAAWIALDDAALDQKIAEIDGRRGDAKRRARARRLFAQTLETPGGLKVQTIHAFCTRLLHQFPFEAKVAARFSVLDERGEDELIAALRMKVLLQAAAEPESGLGRALTAAVAHAAEQSFAEALRAAIAARRSIAAWLAHAGGLDAALAGLSSALGVDASATMESLAQDILAASILAASDADDVIAQLRSGAKTDQDQAARIESAMRILGPEQIELYAAAFLTQKLEPRAQLLTKTLAKALPKLARPSSRAWRRSSSSARPCSRASARAPSSRSPPPSSTAIAWRKRGAGFSTTTI